MQCSIGAREKCDFSLKSSLRDKNLARSEVRKNNKLSLTRPLEATTMCIVLAVWEDNSAAATVKIIELDFAERRNSN